MAEDFPGAQLSSFLGDNRQHQLVLRAPDVPALAFVCEQLLAVDECGLDSDGVPPSSPLDRLLDTVTAVDAIQRVKGMGATMVAPQPAPPPQPYPAAAGQQGGWGGQQATPGGAKTCVHNGVQHPMEYKTGIYKSGPRTGQPYTAWLCPLKDKSHNIWS